MVYTANVGTSVRLDFTAPYDGASPILYYVLVIKSKSGIFYEEATYCNARSDLTVIAAKSCVLPMDVLTAASYNLVQGDIVIAKILAANILGES